MTSDQRLHLSFRCFLQWDAPNLLITGAGFKTVFRLFGLELTDLLLTAIEAVMFLGSRLQSRWVFQSKKSGPFQLAIEWHNYACKSPYSPLKMLMRLIKDLSSITFVGRRVLRIASVASVHIESLAGCILWPGSSIKALGKKHFFSFNDTTALDNGLDKVCRGTNVLRHIWRRWKYRSG